MGTHSPTNDAEMTVAIVVTAYNHARFLSDALGSIAAQTLPPAEVVVIDDGSNDAPEKVCRDYEFVRVVRTENRGLAAARNRGLAEIETDAAVFLDADDILYPEALRTGREALLANPGAAFVHGAFRYLDAELGNPSAPRLRRTGPNARAILLRENAIRMHGAVMYDRRKLAAAGGFDETLPLVEDYDVYLRLAARHPVASHGGLVAGYRRHAGGLSANARAMFDWTRKVHAAHEPEPGDAALHRAWRDGERQWLAAFSELAWSDRPDIPARHAWSDRTRLMRIAPRLTPPAALRALAVRLLPRRAADWLRRINRRPLDPPVGTIDMGDLGRIAPVSADFGFARGTPVDRLYIERFLGEHGEAIGGRVLEIGSDTYSARFGSGIARQDTISVDPADNPTIAGDLLAPGTLPAAAFDCAVVTQTLHLLYDMPLAVKRLHDSLVPGGTMLATVPGISPVMPDASHGWYWSLTGMAAERLFSDVFGEGAVEVQVFGNAFAATCFLQGIAQEDIGEGWLDPVDPAYPVIVAVKAVRHA
ncbi:glycosyltransferase [Altererythrobacter sp. MTPC7]|uniref:glycosyltransferase n=1 Tax=Altererythrobacter sp. MTPC7 TaxID=3056567 RepID=UPI0036F3177C